MNRKLSIMVLGIIVCGCSQIGPSARNVRSTDSQEVLNKTWQWEATVTPVKRITVPSPERYTIFLKDDGKLQANFDCNKGRGDYQISEGKLSFSPLISTRMACPEGTMDAVFMRDLQRVTSFFSEDGVLYLGLSYDSGTMKFLTK